MRCVLFAVLAAPQLVSWAQTYPRTGRARPAPAVNPGSPALPGVPTVAEALPGFDAAAWIGFFAPARTPPEVTARLQDHLRAVLQLPDVVQRTTELAAMPPGLTPEAFAAFAQRDADRWRTLAESANIRSVQ